MAAKSLLGYNPYRDSEGKFDDGPSLLASRGRPKVSASDQRKKIDEAKAKLRAKYAIEEKPDREKVLDGPKYIETPGFAINEQNLSDNDVRTILWRDKELFPGKTYGQYYETEKAKKGDIFMMSAAEYRQALVESGQYKDLESIENRMDWEKVDQYTEDMMSGDKFPPPQLWYDEDGKTQQEGLHRLYAAERVGIESIPVVVSSDTRNQDIYPYNELSSKIVSQDELHGRQQTNNEATAHQPTVKLTVEGGLKAEFPAKYYRMGELPGSEGSRNWNTMELEGGVSVMKGYEDPVTGKITLDGLQNEHLELLAEGDKLYEVEGNFSGLYGSDGEELLDVEGIRYTKEIDPSKVVTDNNPDYNLLGDDVSEQYETFPVLRDEDAKLIKPITPIDSPAPGAEEEPKEVDNPDVRETFYGLSSLGGEHTELVEKKKDPALTFTEEEALEEQIKQVEKDIRAETDKVLDAIKAAPASSSFLEELATTIETEQEIANKNGDELYLTALDKIVLAIGKKQSNKDSVKAEPKAVQSNITDVIVERFSAFSLEAQTQDTLNSATLNKEYKKALADTRKELSSITGAAGGRWSAREDADFIKSVSLKNKPQLVSNDEFETMKNSGDYITVYRNAGKPEYIEAFKNGENPVNPYHMYGTGVYFAVDKNFASGGEFAEGSEPEAIFEALIPKDKFSERPEGWERKDLSSDVAYLAKDGKGAQREVAQTAADQNLTSILSGKAGVHIPNNDRYSDDPFSSEQFVITNPAHMIVRGDS